MEEVKEIKEVDELDSLPAEYNSENDVTSRSIDEYQSLGVSAVKNQFVSGDKSVSEVGKDLAHLTMTAESLRDTDENKKFRTEFKDVKQTELLESAKTALSEEEARGLLAKQRKAEAFYISYRPILEFDLDHLLVKNAPKRLKYKKVLNKDTGRMERVLIDDQSTEEPLPERPKHTYAERSYGIPLMVMMLLVLTIPYFFATIILSIFSMINYLFVAISRFSKPAFIICSSIAGIAIIGVVVYLILLCIEGSFGVKIFP